MGIKKRSSDSVDELVDHNNDNTDDKITSKRDKKPRKEKISSVDELVDQNDSIDDKITSKRDKKPRKEKKSSDSVDELVDQNDATDDKITSKHDKKPRKQKIEEVADDKLPPVTPDSLKPMERRKKRKALDKERHQSSSNIVESVKTRNLSEGIGTDDTMSLPSASRGLPEFHISVFRDLSSVDSSVREAAAEALVRELWEVQKAYEKFGNKGTDEETLKLEAEKDDGLKNCAPSLRYAIRRLIRGISSSRECARQGFALGLTTVIGKIPSIKVGSLMKLIVELLEVSSSMKGQEARDCFLGRLFAYGALVRSGRIAEEWFSDSSTSIVKEFISHVISLAGKKRYLREPAVLVILELVEKLPFEGLLGQVLGAQGIHEWFQSATQIGNPDALFLALKIREKISIDHGSLCKLLPHPFSPNNLFTADHLSSLIPCFKETTFCQPRVHSVWPVLVNILLQEIAPQEEDISLVSTSGKKHKKNRNCNSSKEDFAKNLRCFCEVVIESCLLLSSHDRKHLAFNILLILLPRLPASCVEIVLSHKLVHCLMDILSTQDTWLFKAAQYFLKELSNCVRNDDERRIAVVVALQKHSCGRFDCITRTHTVKDLVAEFETGKGCTLFVQNLMTMFVDEGRAADEPSDQSQTTDENSEMGLSEDKDLAGAGNPDILKKWVIDSLPRVLKNLRLDYERKFQAQKEIIKFLAVQGLFSASLGTEVTSFELQEKFKWPKAVASSGLCRMCIEQLQLLLADAQKGEGSQSVSNSFERNDLGSYFMCFLSTLCNIPSVSLFRQLSDEDDKAFKRLLVMESRMSTQERDTFPGTVANRLCALRYLLIQLLLQILLRPGEFSEAASEIIICCKKAFSDNIFLDSPGGEEDVYDDNSPPEFMDVLVDTLVSLLPQSSSPMSFAVEQVFRFFCDDIMDASLLRMLRVIKKDLKPARHQVMDNVEDDDDDDEEEDFLGIEEAEETDEAETVDTGDSDDHVDDHAMLGAEAINEDLPASDESDSGMDDDAMFRMDSYLAQIFKERKNSAGSETAQSQLVFFKLRVLSLLEIYLHRNPGKAQVLTVYSYLVQAFVNLNTAEGNMQLGQRIGGILQKKIFKAKEYPKGDEIQITTLEVLLDKSLKSATRSRNNAVASLAQNSTFWILKIIHARNFPELELQRVFESLQHILVDYFDSKKCRLKPGFVREIFRRHPWIVHNVFGFLLEKCGSSKSEYRQVRALDLLNDILKSCVPYKGQDKEASSSRLKFLEDHLSSLCDLIQKLLSKLPEKQSRRAEVRRFCATTLRAVSMLNLNKSFLKALKPDAYAVCESHLGDLFLPFKKP
ncbi:DNA polymerase V family [Tasmannia lanceolata]|uniref:DNA polymerase V family n=1 Tax=Tasmannia lanceolata TaxID=3420 RepID=UPI004063FF3C